MVEIICVVLGLIQGILSLLNKRSNWIVYSVQMLFMVIFSFTQKLYGDTIQNFIYMFICIYGFIYWKSGENEIKISKCSVKSQWCGIAVIIVATITTGFILKNTDDPMPFTDAFTTITTIYALLLMSKRKLEAWLVWLINDIAYMYQYFYLPEQALYLFCLYSVWTLLAIATYANWKRIMILNNYEENCV